MFARLGRGEPQLQEWLLSELADAYNVLVKMTDEAQLRVAQGRAQALLRLSSLLKEYGAKGSA